MSEDENDNAVPEATPSKPEIAPAETQDQGGTKRDDSGSAMGTGEIIDREERKALKKAKEEKEAQEKSRLKGLAAMRGKAAGKDKPQGEPDELGNALRQGRLAQTKKKRFKMAFRGGAGLVGVYVLYVLYGWLFASTMAGPAYGVCRVYMELQVSFPSHLRFVGLEDFGSNVRVWYTRTDPFGSTRMESIRCYYGNDPERGTYVEKILIERREEPRDKIEQFNKVLPVVLKNLPDMTWPRPDGEKSIKDITVDSADVRKKVL